MGRQARPNNVSPVADHKFRHGFVGFCSKRTEGVNAPGDATPLSCSHMPRQWSVKRSRHLLVFEQRPPRASTLRKATRPCRRCPAKRTLRQGLFNISPRLSPRRLPVFGWASHEGGSVAWLAGTQLPGEGTGRGGAGDGGKCRVMSCAGARVMKWSRVDALAGPSSPLLRSSFAFHFFTPAGPKNYHGPLGPIPSPYRHSTSSSCPPQTSPGGTSYFLARARGRGGEGKRRGGEGRAARGVNREVGTLVPSFLPSFTGQR